MIQFIKDAIWLIKGPKVVTVNTPPPTIIKPKKPRIHLNIDTSTSLAWKGIVWHHTGDNDDPNVSDYSRIVRYQTSYRIDFNIIADPVRGAFDKNKEYVSMHKGQWLKYYLKSEVDMYNLRKKNGDFKIKCEDPWTTVAYNKISEYVDGNIIVNDGRPFSMFGCHSGLPSNEITIKDGSYFNKNYIGLCHIGNFNTHVVPQDVWEYALGVTRTLMDIFGFDSSKVIGHKEVYDYFKVPRQKECPGTNWDTNKFRNDL